MATQQIYSSNTVRLFPLEEHDSKSELPKDLIIDMSLTIPDGVEPVITAVSITEYNLFVALEDKISRKAIGHICSRYYEPYSVLSFNMVMPGSFGWIVPGPGVSNTATYPMIEESIDKSVILKQPPIPQGAMTDFVINGVTHSAGNVLDIKSLTDTIMIREEVREIEGNLEKCIVLFRNNSAFTTDAIYYALIDNESSAGAVRNIGGAVPDVDGKIFISCASNVPGGNGPFTVQPIVDPAVGDQQIDNLSEIGLVFFEQSELCAPYVYDNRILHGRCEQGIVNELPCDHIIEEFFHPEFKEKDCGCSGD